MGIETERAKLAKGEYLLLSYDTRCWIRFRTEIVAGIALVVGIVVGQFVIP